MPEFLSRLGDLPEPDRRAGEAVLERAGRVLRPVGALARLDEIAVWLAEWQRTPQPGVNRPAVVIFAADHGVVAEGVTAYPSSITRSMVEALEKGVATASVMAAAQGASLSVCDVGVGVPTGNIASEPALDEERFDELVEIGAKTVRNLDCDLLILGEMGIGNTTAAAAIAHHLFAGRVGDWVGPGAGVGPKGLERKRRIVERAVQRVGEVSPIEVLRELGGSELAAIAGAVLEARKGSIPVLLDGYVTTAAVMPLQLAAPGALAHCWPGHLSPEPGHRLLLERIGRRPVLELEMRLGEGSGALAALSVVRLAAAGVVEVATFEEWGV